MREHLGSILHPSTLEPLFGTYFGPIQIDNSKEYNSNLSAFFRSVDSVLVDIIHKSVFLELRIYRTRFRSGASLLLWNRETGAVQELDLRETGSSSFLKQGTFKDGYWSYTKNEKRFNFRLDDTIRQGYTHSAIWDPKLNFQLDALVNTGDKNKSNPFSKIHPSGKNWFFLNHSPELNLEGQLAWNDLSVSLENDSLSYTVTKGFSSDAFPLENRLYLRLGNQKKAHLYLDEQNILWQNGDIKILDQIDTTNQGKTKILKSSQMELLLEPELEASFRRPTTLWGNTEFIKSLYTISGWIKPKSKKEKVTDGLAILEELH